MINFLSRMRAAWSVIAKRSSIFNRVLDLGEAGVKLHEPYRQSTWVMRAIKKIAGPVSAVPLEFSGQPGALEAPVDDPDLAAFWGGAPAAGVDMFADAVEASIGWLKLRGEFFWLLDDSALMPFPEVAGPGQRFKPFVIARPDKMREVVNGGALTGWVFMDAGGKQHVLLPEQVVQCKYWNPYNQWRGMAEMDSCGDAAEADFLAAKYNLNLMRNNGDQGPYIIAKSGIPDDGQRAQIVEQLRQKKELSLRGIFKPLFLTGDISVEDAKAQVPDANFAVIRAANQEEIFLAFGVPPSMAHKMASYSIGSASDWYMLLMETCVPTGAKLASAIAKVATRQLGRAMYAAFDWDEHPVMQAVRRERMDSMEKLWSKGMPMEGINDYLRLGLPEFEGWDVGYLPFSVSAVGSAAPENDAAFAEAPTDLPAENAENAEAETEPAIAEMFRVLGKNDFQRARPEKEVAAWRDQMGKRRKTVKSFQGAFNRELLKARAEVLRKLERASQRRSHEAPLQETKAAAADFLFDLADFRKGLLASMRKVAAAALQESGQQLFAEIGKDDPFSFPPSEVLDFLRGRENKISGVAQNVFDDIKGTIKTGLDEGKPTAEIAGDLRARFNGMSRERSMTIALTETSAAYGSGRQKAMTTAGVKYKRWLTSGNPNVRPAHAAANNKVVGIDEAYDVGGEPLMYPGDPDGSPENVINCHCVSIAILEKPTE